MRARGDGWWWYLFMRRSQWINGCEKVDDIDKEFDETDESTKETWKRKTNQNDGVKIEMNEDLWRFI